MTKEKFFSFDSGTEILVIQEIGGMEFYDLFKIYYRGKLGNFSAMTTVKEKKAAFLQIRSEILSEQRALSYTVTKRLKGHDKI